ncbi:MULTISPECIES: hypothetical protein [Pseudonocardia]|nr:MULTISPECIES: hypothetical protein [Pseudonocardia]
MTVRRATPDDLPALVDLALGLFREDSGRRDPYADPSWPRRRRGAGTTRA